MSLFRCRSYGEAQTRCSKGYVPRFGEPARRPLDCALDCRDYKRCEQKPAALTMPPKETK